MGSAACNRNSVRHRPKGRPAPDTNARARVRSLAPTAMPHSARVRLSAGSRRSASATRRAGSPAGIPSEIVVTGIGLSRSASSASACVRGPAASPAPPRYAISSASSGVAATTTGSVQLATAAPGRMYRDRMVARPAAPVSCGRPAGIHSARLGGSTQVDCSVSTVSTPLKAQASW